MKATSHKILKSAAIAAAVIAVVITALSFYMLNFALSPQRRSHDERVLVLLAHAANVGSRSESGRNCLARH